MDAKKCDRCGGFYIEKENKSDFDYITIYERNGNEYKIHDLCDKCTKELIDFMECKGKKLK